MKVYMGNIEVLDKIDGTESFSCFASSRDRCMTQTADGKLGVFTNLKVLPYRRPFL